MRLTALLPAVTLALAIWAANWVSPSPAPAGSVDGRASSAAPVFTVKDLEGHTVRFSEFKGRPVVLDFWATWCGPCRTSMPHLQTMHRRYQPQGLVVLGLSVDEQGPAEVKRFAQNLGVTFRLGMADERVLDQYGPIRAIPTTFFINRKGEVVRRVRGYIDPETLEAYVREVL